MRFKKKTPLIFFYLFLTGEHFLVFWLEWLRRGNPIMKESLRRGFPGSYFWNNKKGGGLVAQSVLALWWNLNNFSTIVGKKGWMERKREDQGHIFSDEGEIVCMRRVGKNHTALEQRFVPGLGISGSQQNKGNFRFGDHTSRWGWSVQEELPAGQAGAQDKWSMVVYLIRLGGFATLWPWVFERIGEITQATLRAMSAMVDWKQVGTGGTQGKRGRGWET